MIIMHLLSKSDEIRGRRHAESCVIWRKISEV